MFEKFNIKKLILRKENAQIAANKTCKVQRENGRSEDSKFAMHFASATQLA